MLIRPITARALRLGHAVKPSFPRRWSRSIIPAAALTAAALVVPAGGTALAKSAPFGFTARSANTRMTAPMTIVGVARLLTSSPDKAGQLKVELDNGAVIPIPAADRNLVMRRAAAEARAAGPDGIKHGSCGSSWIYQYEKSDDHPIKIETGFKVKAAAIDYGWNYTVKGPAGWGVTFSASGTLAFRHSWSNTYNTPEDYPAGTYSAAVSSSSEVLLVTGAICYSLGPTAKNDLSSPDEPVSWSLSTSGSAAVGSRHAGSGADGQAPRFTRIVLSGFAGRAGRMAPDSVIGKDTRKRVTNTTVYPYRAIALLRVTFPHGTGTCTGFLVSANLVATAGHCVYYLPAGGRATRVQVIPGNNAKSEPFGSCLGVTAYSVKGWVKSRQEAYDYGAVKLNCDIGDTVGWFGMRWQANTLTGTSVTITGYPTDKKPDDSMWTASGKITDSRVRQLLYKISTNRGQSGSPVYNPGCETYCALAIHAYGLNPNHPDDNAGTRITLPAFYNFVIWRS
jgi:glutamyl endopeptidase